MNKQIQIQRAEGWRQPDRNKYVCKTYEGYADLYWLRTDNDKLIPCVDEFSRNNGGIAARLVNINDDDTVTVIYVTGKEVMTPELAKPLVLERKALITRLQENLAAEEKKRADAEAEIVKARADAVEAIGAFTVDELYNILYANWTVEVELLKQAHEDKRYVTKALKPTKTESDLEKFVRVLGMSSEDTIEVVPTENLYSLL